MEESSAKLQTERTKISAFVICCNEESHIRRCLQSVSWCDEIVVVDSGSQDNTLSICREYTTRIFERPWPGFVEQKRFGLSQCTHDWILNLDADEEVSPGLRDEITKILSLQNTSNSIDGYYIPRVVFYLGKWWRKGGWYPEYRLRLCRRNAATWGGDDPHEKAIVKGRTARLSGELFHYTYENLSQQINSLNSLSSAAAQTLYKRGERFLLLYALLRPPVRFLKFFVLRRGYREGVPGFIVGCLEAYYVFLKYVKLWEKWTFSK